MGFRVIILDVMLTVILLPILYIPVLAGCAAGLFSKIGVSSLLQCLIGCVCFTNVLVSILALFEYRHHTVLPVNSPFRFQTSVRIAYILGNFCFCTGGFVVVILLAPADQEGSKLKVVEILKCVPPNLFTPAAFVLDLTPRTQCFLAGLAVVVISQFIFLSSHGFYVLSKQSGHMSSKTRRLQKHFFYNLCAQVSIPMIFMCSPLVIAFFFVNTNTSFDGRLNL
ncbi:unnamed protein product [Caenorhabditis auriculariae]|uniref:Uncharacterized protein n=1 Tax=Caenorhabditis auriculariae TaxID=2777116 RepID=A0A8S1H1T1_9PELO|nr:unnamed protein product [Caenorhabditis auriculariae]